MSHPPPIEVVGSGDDKDGDKKDDGITPTTSPIHDPEKYMSRTGTHSETRISDQIPHEMLEVLAPNGEWEYITSKVDTMSTEEALAIVSESLEFHSDDWNFPSDMRDRMRKLLDASSNGGEKEYGPFYERDLRTDAVLMKYSSPYPGVRAVAELTDDRSVPIETFRAYFLGISWAVIGTFMSTFFNSRFPAISEFCAQIWMHKRRQRH